jgi:hypothetical protein
MGVTYVHVSSSCSAAGIDLGRLSSLISVKMGHIRSWFVAESNRDIEVTTAVNLFEFSKRLRQPLLDALLCLCWTWPILRKCHAFSAAVPARLTLKNVICAPTALHS